MDLKSGINSYINSKTDAHDEFAEILRLEHSISQNIYKDNKCYVHFDKTSDKLNVVTYNPNHHTYFLLCSIPHENTYLSTLKKVNEYIDSHTNTKDCSSYTVQWKYMNDDIKTSYFWAKSIEEVIEKVYYKKEKNKLDIHLIKLNPSS